MTIAAPKPIRVFKNATQESFASDIVPLKQPAILKGLVSHWPCVKAWRESETALCELIESHSLGKDIVTFNGAPDMGGRFFYNDDIRTFNFEKRQETLSNLLSRLRNREDEYFYAGGVNVPQHLPEFAKDHSVPMIAPDSEHLMSIWLGNKTRIPPHWDLPQNIACVTAGRRRFTLFPPNQMTNLYMGPIDNTLAGQPCSLVDLRAPDLGVFPKYEEAAKHALSAELDAGDAIYIPSLWLHQVESLDDFGMLVNFWWRDGPKYMFTPNLTLMHALLSLRDLPKDERDHWRDIFDLYIFNADDTALAHIPKEAQGVLGDMSDERAANLRQFLALQLMPRG